MSLYPEPEISFQTEQKRVCLEMWKSSQLSLKSNSSGKTHKNEVLSVGIFENIHFES